MREFKPNVALSSIDEVDKELCEDRASIVQSIFSSIAPKYDIFNSAASFGIYRRWLKTVAAEANCSSTDRVLDLAAGTGDVTFEICKRSNPQSITCTDFCSEMLKLAKKREAHEGPIKTPITYEIVDATNLPYADESFEVVTVAYGLRNFNNRARALEEAYRVLVPGGKYIILEFATPKNRVWRNIYYTYLKVAIPLIGRLLAHNREGFEYFRDSIIAFPEQETVVEALKSVGFSNVTYTDKSGGIVAVYVATV